jgi:hypothetical protein
MAFARHTAPRLGKPSFSSAKAAAPQPLGGGGLMIELFSTATARQAKFS